MKKARMVPGALVAVVVSILINLLYKALAPTFVVKDEHLVQIPVPSGLSEFASLFQFPDFSRVFTGEVIITAITLATVASVETLLCIEAVDKMDPMRRVTNQNRELRAQGVGNIVSGLLGGLPVTSVIVRSTANLNAGAKTKMSAILHGVLILICVASIPGILNMIPLGALAAILLMTGYKLAKPTVFKQMFSNGKFQWIPFLITVIAVVRFDLLTGVGLGLVASIIAILYGNMKNSYYFHKKEHHDGELIHIRLSEEVSFLNKASIKLTLDHLPENSTVLIDATATHYIDFDVLELIKEFHDVKAPLKNIKCILSGFKEEYNITNTHNVQSEPMNNADVYAEGKSGQILATH